MPLKGPRKPPFFFLVVIVALDFELRVSDLLEGALPLEPPHQSGSHCFYPERQPGYRRWCGQNQSSGLTPGCGPAGSGFVHCLRQWGTPTFLNWCTLFRKPLSSTNQGKIFTCSRHTAQTLGLISESSLHPKVNMADTHPETLPGCHHFFRVTHTKRST
jgi:hypothetical protein